MSIAGAIATLERAIREGEAEEAAAAAVCEAIAGGASASGPATAAAGFAGLFALLSTGMATTAASKLLELARERPLGDAAPHVLELAMKTVHGYVRQELVKALVVDAQRRGDEASVSALVEHSHPGVARHARSAVKYP